MGNDRIVLRGLRARGRHGCLPAERELYGALADRLVAVVEGEPVNLIETLAERLAALCLDPPQVEEVEVTVHKPSAPMPHPFTDVAVTIHRSRP